MRKYKRHYFVKGHWVFVWFWTLLYCDSRSYIKDASRSFETWIEPGTLMILVCWRAYQQLDERHYQHTTINHSLYFKDPVAGACINTIESYWCHFKSTLLEYSRQGDFGAYIVMFMFRIICRIQKLNPFVKFLDDVWGINWTDWHIVSGMEVKGSLE